MTGAGSPAVSGATGGNAPAAAPAAAAPPGGRLAVDERRIYASGMSNGGMMSHRLACEMADSFRAIAAVAVGGLHGGEGHALSPWLLLPLMMMAAGLAGAARPLGRALDHRGTRPHVLAAIDHDAIAGLQAEALCQCPVDGGTPLAFAFGQRHQRQAAFHRAAHRVVQPAERYAAGVRLARGVQGDHDARVVVVGQGR